MWSGYKHKSLAKRSVQVVQKLHIWEIIFLLYTTSSNFSFDKFQKRCQTTGIFSDSAKCRSCFFYSVIILLWSFFQRSNCITASIASCNLKYINTHSWQGPHFLVPRMISVLVVRTVLDFPILLLSFLHTLFTLCHILLFGCWIFFQYHHCVKQFGSRSGPTFCQAWPGSKLFIDNKSCP